VGPKRSSSGTNGLPERPQRGRPGGFALPYSGSVGSGKRWQLIHFSDKTLTVTKKAQKKATGTRGRSTKKTDSLAATLLRLISDGGPYDLCCQAVGITRETFYDWRRDDPAFAAQVEQAAAKGSLGRLKKIEQHGQNDWHAFGWMLERRHPEHFARAEAQLNVIAQAAVVNGNGTPHNVQMVVVSDLEFVGLKRHPAYTHRSGVVREAEQVPPELAGTLERGNENIIVRGESAAKAKARRYAEIHARTKELFETRPENTGKVEPPIQRQLSPDLDGSLCREDQNIVVFSESKAEVQKLRLAEAQERLGARHNTMPTENVSASCAPSAKPASWWRQFIFPDALIPKADATLALRLILSQLRISVDDRALDFQTDQIVQTTFCEALEKLTGSDLGWRTMTQIFERELQRADHQR
jgi:hypothetical protein